MASRQVPQATIIPQSNGRGNTRVFDSSINTEDSTHILAGAPIFVKPLGNTTSSGQHLLQPYRSPEMRKEKSVIVEVSSRDRNYNQNVLSNPFRWQFARPLKDVKAVELLAGTIPANPYNIIHGANSFTFNEGGICGNEWVITIPPGRYTCDSLLLKLNELFTCISCNNDYVWTIDPHSGRLMITKVDGIVSFGILFISGETRDDIDRSDAQYLKQNSLALQLGFDISDYYDCKGVIVAPFPLDLASSMNRIYLYINFDNSLDLGCIERGAGRRWPFAIIYLDEQTNGYKYLNKETITQAFYSLPQPFSRLQNLFIDFRDEWYRPIHFDGKDFSLLLNITTLE